MGSCSTKPVFSSLRKQKHEQHAPMWVVKLSHVLEMPKGPPVGYEDLQRMGMLVEYQYQPEFLCIFVSHQWYGSSHPDRFGEQLQVFQQALKNIISGEVEVENDGQTQFLGIFLKLGRAERERLQDAYVWMDWFSVPQSASSGERRSACISSIPFYVECCEIFLVLVPCVHHNDTGVECDYRSYLQRGWCRTEMMCKLLSDNDRVPIVVVSSPGTAAFMVPCQWVHSPAPDGDFTVDKDRELCSEIIKVALACKIDGLKYDKKKRNLYRYLVARFESFCGLPSKSRNLSTFLHDFNFQSLQEAVKQRHGMGAVACCAVSGDLERLKDFVARGAPVETKLPALPELDLGFPGFTPLMLATQNSWHSVAPVAELLHLKANSNAKATGISVLAEACTAETVRLLVEHRAEINAVQDPWRLPPLAVMAARPAVEMAALQEMLSLRADVNAGSYAPFISLAAHYNGHANGPKVAQLLLDARADVNKAGSCESMLFSVLGMFSRTCSRCIQTQPILMKYFANLKGCTPLTCAVLMGDLELAKLLLLQRADPDIKNYNGKKPFEVALNDEMRRKFEALRATEEEDETGLHVLRACKSQLVEVAL